jgi:hypothetical protein
MTVLAIRGEVVLFAEKRKKAGVAKVQPLPMRIKTMARQAPWRMIEIVQRYRKDQVLLVDGLISELRKAGVPKEEVNRSNIIRLAVDLGLAVLEEVTVPELLQELQSEHNRKYDAFPTPNS